MIATAEGGVRAGSNRRGRPGRGRSRGGQIELSRELHDHVSQTLNLLLLEMELFKAEQVGRAGVLKELDRIQTSIRVVIANVREIVHEIRMDETTVEDMRRNLKVLAERLESSARVDVSVTVDHDWPSDLQPRAVIDLVRIVEEAAHNSVIHGAPSKIWIDLAVTQDYLTASVRDDGRGMVGGVASAGLGIRGMRERAGLLGGALKIDSEIGKGTRTVVEIPRLRTQPAGEALGLIEAHSA